MGAVSVPAPVGGWNAKDALAAMPASDAVRLVNWIPRGTYCQTRRGYALHASGLGAAVETLVPYRGTSAQKLIAGANGRLWDVTTAATQIGTGFTDNRWQATNHTGRLILCNGADPVQVFDGATLAAATITGVSSNTLWGAVTFKGRVFYWQKNAQSFWYAAAGSFQGALSQFQLQTQLQTGGTLVQVVTWTLDAGDGVDDLLAFIFSTGEVLVYQGDDPASATAWSMIGRFQIGEPLGIRAHAKVGGTEIIITRDGYLDLSVALKDARVSEETAYSAKIIRATKAAAAQYGGFDGWEAVLYPAGQLFIVNVPTSATTAQQHVRETSTGGWCEFTGWNARCFATFNNRLYFGSADGNVYRADVTTADNGERIESWAIPAFNALGSRAQRKQLTAASVVSNVLRPSSYALDGLADYTTGPLLATLADDPGSASGVWDVADWDAVEWAVGDDSPTTEGWRNVHAIGVALTVSIRIRQRTQAVNWYSTTYQFRNAGVI